MDETIHQFRQYVYQMDYATDSFPELDDGCSCPACFEVLFFFYNTYFRIKSCSVEYMEYNIISSMGIETNQINCNLGHERGTKWKEKLYRTRVHIILVVNEEDSALLKHLNIFTRSASYTILCVEWVSISQSTPFQNINPSKNVLTR